MNEFLSELKADFLKLLKWFLLFMGCIATVAITGAMIRDTFSKETRKLAVKEEHKNYELKNKELKDCKLVVEEADEIMAEGVRNLVIPTLYIIRCPTQTTTTWREQQGKESAERQVTIQ